ncbi:hypothetical protein DM02DRAFT_631148 [Periconia macrospinosa]|uniref:Uncharacterized protein n=1 Tax=Periconia macrospinosa TaxID=97972 RepID=A0A2V1DH11_9PLEO|nr:hypothetical protein DM02DRAFT_631148 [Periconia macrospinosa]
MWIANAAFDEIKRRLNRLLGRPSTKEIAPIAKVLSEIKNEVQQKTGLSVTEAAIAVPNLFEAENIRRQQFQLDLDETSNCAGIKPLMTGDWVSAASAGVASQNWGLCLSFTDTPACEMEEENFPLETALTVEHTKDALIVAIFTMNNVQSVSDKHTRIWYSIGADHEKYDEHWTLVKERIQELPMDVYERAPTKVLATGEAAKTEKFFEVLREAVEGLGIRKQTSEPEASGYNPLFAVARGAAEFVRRRQEAPPN